MLGGMALSGRRKYGSGDCCMSRSQARSERWWLYGERESAARGSTCASVGQRAQDLLNAHRKNCSKRGAALRLKGGILRLPFPLRVVRSILDSSTQSSQSNARPIVAPGCLALFPRRVRAWGGPTQLGPTPQPRMCLLA